MTMSESAISITALSKSFRRFKHPGWRALSALGIAVPNSKYDTFSALRNINIEIKRGEKVALIGRNGAGKSTLLRLICGQMRPDQGRIAVNGKVQALMELGTGFHPEFTGIGNIRSALAYQGLSSKQVEYCVDEITDFTELDDFLFRPVKEYSAGMYARLAFAVATTIAPEVLIIDEVLGAGDAYFTGKCIQRMKALTGQGATVLFVSHDMSAVQLLCDRGIWIDKGNLRADGDLLPVSKLYLASIREEEEARVRARSMSLTKKHLSHLLVSDGSTTLLRLLGSDGSPPKEPFFVASIRYGDQNGQIAELLPGEISVEGSGPILDKGLMNWRSGQRYAGKQCWSFADYGGRYYHAPLQLVWPRTSREGQWIEFDCLNSSNTSMSLDQFDPITQTYQKCTQINPPPHFGWQQIRVELRSAVDVVEPIETITSLIKELPELATEDRYGSGELHVTGFAFFDNTDTQRHTLVTGEPVSAVLSYKASRFIAEAIPVVAVYRPDGTCAMQLVGTLNGYEFKHFEGTGVIRVNIESLYLGPGDYLVSVALFKQLNLASSIESEAYDLHDRCYALKVLPPAGVGVEIGTVNQPAAWEMLR